MPSIARIITPLALAIAALVLIAAAVSSPSTSIDAARVLLDPRAPLILTVSSAASTMLLATYRGLRGYTECMLVYSRRGITDYNTTYKEFTRLLEEASHNGINEIEYSIAGVHAILCAKGGRAPLEAFRESLRKLADSMEFTGYLNSEKMCTLWIDGRDMKTINHYIDKLEDKDIEYVVIDWKGILAEEEIDKNSVIQLGGVLSTKMKLEILESRLRALKAISEPRIAILLEPNNACREVISLTTTLLPSTRLVIATRRNECNELKKLPPCRA